MRTTVGSAYRAGDPTLTVAAGEGNARMPATGDFWVRIEPTDGSWDGFIRKVTSRSGDVLTFDTGTDQGTIDHDAPVGCLVYWVLSAGALTQLKADLASGGTGARFYIMDGLRSEYDPPPSQPNADDDEFNSPTLSPAWTVDVNNAAEVNIDTRWRSHLYVRFDGNQTFRIQRPIENVDFRLSGCFRIPITADNQQCAIMASSSDGMDSVRVRYQYYRGPRVSLTTRDRGVITDRQNYTIGVKTKIYLALVRIGNEWSAWFSDDGLAWGRAGEAHVKTFAVSHVSLDLGQSNSVVPCEMGIDWFRRDWAGFGF